MASVAVTLGGVAFRDFEIPVEIAFGGKQLLAVHQPVGGGRIVDVLGASAGQISFSGTFSGPDAELRAQLLDVARDAGATLPLAWSGFAYSVVIVSFQALYQKPWWIPFKLVLLSVENLVTALPSALVQAGLDLASASGFSALSGISLSGVSANAGSIGAAQASVAGAVSGAGLLLGAADTAFSGGTGAAQPIAALASLGAASSALAGAAAAQAYVGRAAANIGLGAL